MDKTIRVIRLMQLIAQVRKTYSWNPAASDCLDMLVAYIEKDMESKS